MDKIGYARVSTQDQNLELQIDALKKAGCKKIFTEKMSSRKERPELNKCLEYLREGDVLVIWKLDRLGRTTKELIQLADDLEERNIGLHITTQGIDTTTPAGRMFFIVMGAMAEMERELNRERTMAGLEAARARGRKGGRPPVNKEDLERAFILYEGGLKLKDVLGTINIGKTSFYKYYKKYKKQKS